MLIAFLLVASVKKQNKQKKNGIVANSHLVMGLISSLQLEIVIDRPFIFVTHAHFTQGNNETLNVL